MSNDFRPHVVMGIIILILALALIVVTFIPKPPVIFHQQISPGSGGQIAPFNQPASIVTQPSLMAGQLALEISQTL